MVRKDFASIASLSSTYLKCLWLDAVVKCPSKSEKDFHKAKQQTNTFVFSSLNWENTYKVAGEVGFTTTTLESNWRAGEGVVRLLQDLVLWNKIYSLV